MEWGFFSITHIITLIFAVGTIPALHFMLRKRSWKTQLWVLGPLSFLGVISVIYHLVAHNCPLENLPLHLCSINALVLPIAVFTRNKTLGNLLLLWCLGALMALVLNNATAAVSIFSWSFFYYYFPHVVEFAFPILMVSLGHVKKEPKSILVSVGISMGLYTCVHFANMGLNKYFTAHNVCNPSGNLIQANYMYTLEPNNPMCEFFQNLIPGPYWYMYLAIPLLVAYLLIIYAPDIIRSLKNKKSTTKTA